MAASKIFKHLNPEESEMFQAYIDACLSYEEGEPIMPDVEFDQLEENLVNLNIPELTTFIETSIRKKDGFEIVSPETQEMISLFKIKWKSLASINEILKYFPRNVQLFYAPKLDGAAIKFEKNLKTNEIQKIISRGGLDITDKFKENESFKYWKNNLPYSIVTGELVCKKTIFNEFYSIENGGEYENARNFVGTLIKQHDISSQILNHLEFVALTNGVNPVIETKYWQRIERNELPKLEQIIQYFKSDKFPFLCDGIVLAYFEEGPRKIKNNYPLNMVAIKFPGARAKTKVIDIVYNQKKSGNLNPMLILEPVLLEGSTMTCANGYNYQYLLDKKVGIGSEIEIEKSGDIIPILAKVLTFSNNIKLPNCEYRKIGKHLKAVDLFESRKYKFILGLKQLQLDGIGPTLAEQIGSIVNYQIFELFNPKYKPDICNILGGGDRWNKFKEFYNIKSIFLNQLIELHQFDQVGPVIASKIALLLTKQSNDVSNIPKEVIANVVRGEGFKRITDSLNYLKIHGITVRKPIDINTEDFISFEMTGNPPGMTKEEFVNKFKKVFPNSIHETMKKTTKFLICDDVNSNTGKCNKARKYNIKTITYGQALKGEL
jgi:NAD-dependent DNA ligase